MELNAKKIINLPVFTQFGKELGKISGFDVKVETQSIARYYVKSHHLIGELFGKELVVSASQVISLTNKKMTVEDLILKEKDVFKKEALIADRLSV